MRNIPNNAVSSIGKAIAVLFSFAERSPQGIREIARRIRVPVSTVYRLVRMLRAEGLIHQDPTTQKYYLGLRLLELQEPVFRQLDIAQAARPHMMTLAGKYHETVQLTLRREFRAVTVEVVESREPLRFAPPRGGSVPLHCGAQAKAILAFLPRPEIDRYIRKSALRAFTCFTIRDGGVLVAEVLRIQRVGYARSSQELYLGAAGVAAPVFDQTGNVIASYGVSGPLHRLRGKRMQAVAADVVRDARLISKELGAPLIPS